jgi:phosphoglycerate dehydrogenase-like enzyme
MHIVIWITHRRVPEWALSAAQAERLALAVPGARVTRCESEEAFRAALRDADVALVWTFKQEWFAEARRLRVLSTPAAGREYLNVTPPPGVSLRFGEFHGAIMGETVLALMLGFCRGVIPHAHAMRPPVSEYWPREAFSGHARRLHGAHVVILGFGNIGQWVARLAKPFGARITGIRRSPSPALPSFFGPGDRILGLDALDTVLPTADHLILTLPATAETDHILDTKRIALLRPSAFVVNVGRGNAIDEAALGAALHAQRIAAAALDVFACEPLPADSPLRTVPNCYLYPHASAIAPDYLDLYVDEVIAFL